MSGSVLKRTVGFAANARLHSKPSTVTCSRNQVRCRSECHLLYILRGSSPNCNNNLNTLGKKSIRELCMYNGIGEAKAISILAACELGKRRQKEVAEQRKDLGSATAIYEYVHPMMKDLDVEEAWIILMNQNYKLIRAQRISHGGITETAVDVRIIIKEAILSNATILALCHNHPSNNPTPSSDDDRLTQRVKKACETMRIYFLDHLIICDGQYYSYHERGRL